MDDPAVRIPELLRPPAQWLVLLVPAAAIAAVYIANAAGWEWLLRKGTHEVLAPIILGLTVLILAVRARRKKRLWWRMLTILAAVFLLREIHPRYSTKVAYVLLAVWGVAAVWRRNELLPGLRRVRFRALLGGMFAAYVVSQMVGQRWLRHVLPLESRLHISFEETLETAAHLMFLALAVFGRLPESAAPEGCDASGAASPTGRNTDETPPL